MELFPVSCRLCVCAKPENWWTVELVLVLMFFPSCSFDSEGGGTFVVQWASTSDTTVANDRLAEIEFLYSGFVVEANAWHHG